MASSVGAREATIWQGRWTDENLRPPLINNERFLKTDRNRSMKTSKISQDLQDVQLIKTRSVAVALLIINGRYLITIICTVIFYID